MLKKYQQILEYLLIIGLFTLANVSAFLTFIWLIPEVVFIELVIWLILTSLCIWILWKHGFVTMFFTTLQKNWVILPFFILSGFSIFWSINWEISLARWLMLLFTIITAGYIGLRYNLKEIIKSLTVFGLYILILSSLIIFFIPKIGVMNYFSIQGAWKGLYWHKNHMGLISAFINILFLLNLVYSMQVKNKNTLFWAILYLFSLWFVYQTDTVAAYLTVIGLHGLILLAIIFIKYREKLNTNHYIVFVFTVVIVSILLYINLDSVFKLLNRSPTLTGRIPMWAYLFDTYFIERQFLGYGFNAFWYVESYRVDIGLAANYPGPILIADNGFIDILMNTGYIGLILFLLFYFSVWRSVIKYSSNAKNIYEMFPLVLMSYTFIANISWSLLFENEGFFMMLVIAVLFCISKNPQEKSR